MNRAYILVFNRNFDFDYNLLHKGIKDNPYIINWWHYLFSSYLLISPNNAKELARSIRIFFPHKFLLMEIKSNNYYGWLSSEAWEWIKKYIGAP